MKRFWLAKVVTLAVLASPVVARADTPPNVWDLAKNPNAAAQWRQHLELENEMALADELAGEPHPVAVSEADQAKDKARVLAESYAGPKDRWLRFDDAWLAMQRHDYASAVSILESLTRDFNGELFAIEIWQKLAECYVRLERTKDEIHAYDEVLARATADVERLTPLLNQGEAYMRTGDPDAAVERFREVLAGGARVSSSEIYLLAQWDLALALDRSGDLRNGRAAALAAVRMDSRCVGVTKDLSVVVATNCEHNPIILITEVPSGLFVVTKFNTTVYFVPEYEREWYLALGYSALAQDADSKSHAAEHWRAAEAAITNYVNHATMHGGDRWLDLARRRLEEIRARRLEADGQPPKAERKVSSF